MPKFGIGKFTNKKVQLSIKWYKLLLNNGIDLFKYSIFKVISKSPAVLLS